MTVRFLSVRGALGVCALAAAFGAGVPAFGQAVMSRPVVQPLPPPEAAQLSAALQQLAGNPRDLDSLIAAGNASLKLDDIDAALGFFARAEEIAPGDPRPKAGRAAAMVREENPFGALRLFDEAERAGASLADLASERALAYDLVGDNARAQELYRSVLARGEDPEAARRLGISLAISGDQQGMERVLLPMLQRQDLAAYRARAFSLAILGKVEEATTISGAVMPKSMAAQVDPYLRYMPRLTRAQQAAAANLGNFPRSADIGRDDPRIAQYASASVPVATLARTADSRLVPAGEPLGPATSEAPAQTTRLKAEGGRAEVTYRPMEQVPASELPPAEPEPIREFEPPPSAVAVAEPAVAEPAVAEPAQVALAEVPAPGLSITAPAEPVAEPAPEPAFDLATVAGSRGAPGAAEAPAPEQLAATAPVEPAAVEEAAVGGPLEVAVAPSQPAAARTEVAEAQVAAASSEAALAPAEALNAQGEAIEQASVASAFSDFAFSLAPTAQATDAVDIARIIPKRERVVKEEAKPAAPKLPRRFWVQLATGRDRGRLSTDFRRISADFKGVLKDSKAFLADWGETNRLLTGPFKTEGAAQAFVTKLNQAGLKTFTFTSAEGEEITPVAAR